MAGAWSHLVFDSFLLFCVICTAVSVNVTCPSSPVRKYRSSTTIDPFGLAKVTLLS